MGATPAGPGVGRGGNEQGVPSRSHALGQRPPADELHVWQASLDLPPEQTVRLRALLNREEIERAERFRFDRDRGRFIAGRGVLRMLLARYTGQPPEEIEIVYGEHRKPRLGSPGPWFNLSHSGNIALFVFSSQAEIGIDVELADPTFAGARIPEHYFSAAEVRCLRSLRAKLQPRAFLECWTRKEAFIKARGDGLSLALDSFTVTLGPGAPVALVRTAWSRDEPTQWSVVDLSDPDGAFIAAVATRSRGWHVIKHRVADIVGDAIVSD